MSQKDITDNLANPLSSRNFSDRIEATRIAWNLLFFKIFSSLIIVFSLCHSYYCYYCHLTKSTHSHISYRWVVQSRWGNKKKLPNFKIYDNNKKIIRSNKFLCYIQQMEMMDSKKQSNIFIKNFFCAFLLNCLVSNATFCLCCFCFL